VECYPDLIKWARSPLRQCEPYAVTALSSTKQDDGAAGGLRQDKTVRNVAWQVIPSPGPRPMPSPAMRKLRGLRCR
jgi:hypothetical protein